MHLVLKKKYYEMQLASWDHPPPRHRHRETERWIRERERERKELERWI